MFQEFEYIPSLYTLSDELRSEERKQKTMKQEAVAGAQPFVCSDTAARMKHEEGYASFTRAAERTQEQLDYLRIQIEMRVIGLGWTQFSTKWSPSGSRDRSSTPSKR